MSIADTICSSMHSVPTVNCWITGSTPQVNVDTSLAEHVIHDAKKRLKAACAENFEDVQKHMDFFGVYASCLSSACCCFRSFFLLSSTREQVLLR